MRSGMWIAVAAALGAAGCNESMTSSDPDEMRTALDGARDEVDEHVAAVTEADSLVAVRDEAGRHQRAMDDVMGMMGSAIDDMPHCMGRGTGALRDLHESMGGEMVHHGAALERAESLDAAATEVTRHAGALDGVLGDMEEASGEMRCM